MQKLWNRGFPRTIAHSLVPRYLALQAMWCTRMTKAANGNHTRNNFKGGLVVSVDLLLIGFPMGRTRRSQRLLKTAQQEPTLKVINFTLFHRPVLPGRTYKLSWQCCQYPDRLVDPPKTCLHDTISCSDCSRLGRGSNVHACHPIDSKGRSSVHGALAEKMW